MDYVIILGTCVLFLVYSKYRYSSGPFKQWQDTQPKFVWFPKYIVSFDQPISEIQNNLQKIGFVEVAPQNGVYTRGKVYGDFSAKHLLLQVEILEDKKSFRLLAKTFVLFDTVDLWRVCKEVVSSKNP
ncbi:hypothetical protein [Alteromonas stellipolaris]|uniref:Uncharacterized protein n=1 Tax=Alteromonas stellipolaris TaxID=233316 RepID=A0AAW7Z3R0_9ALTE|nr:hypothetical protein [Alteromonas stellipolaris]MDO6577977.1 hypothetical protein [Alteromonas stellipolaris]